MNKTVPRNILVMLLYWGFSLCTELLTIPPDYATPVWPSAGIALGFVVVYGARVYPGIFLGALAANVYASFSQGISINLEQIAFASAVAVGATIQAGFARFLLVRLHLLPHELTSGLQIIKFLLIAGPVSCLVNSLNGATLLGIFGIVPWGSWLSNWIVWWVGDSVGALVVAPFVIRLLKWSADEQRGMLSAVMPVTFLMLVIASFYFVRGLEQANRRALIADIGQQFEAVLTVNVNELRVVLESLSSFMSASKQVTFDDFSTFSTPLLGSNASILALQWAPLVEDEDRSAFVAKVRTQGFPLFEIREVGLKGQMVVSRDQPRYLPLTYIHPMGGNERAHGLDVLGLPYRDEPGRILKTGEPEASDPLALVQDPDAELSYVMAAPVRDRSTWEINGLAQVIFNIRQLVERTIKSHDLRSALKMVDVSGSEPVVIYQGSEAGNRADWSSQFQLLGRSIRIELYSTTAIMKRVSSWQSYAILIGGLLYVALLEAVLLTMLTRQRFVEQQVEIKTKELAQAKDFAEKASMSKTEFLASMSHELRTPLNSVIGFTNRVLRRSGSKLDERSRESLVIVERNANHLLGVINNLLDISKVDLGKLELVISDVAVDELLVGARDQFMPLAKAKENKLTLECEFHGQIQADATRLRQVVINLLSNAVKFTAGGEINVTLMEEARDGIAGVLLQVTDDGVGISQDDIGKLFNKFQKVGSVERLNPEGTGLGLALVKELVELHGGTVAVVSELGKGTTFTIWLPQFHKVRQ